MNDAVTSHELHLACNGIRSEFSKELDELRLRHGMFPTNVKQLGERVSNLETSFVKLSDLVDRIVEQLMDME